ncbi:PilN domain-containing protein [Pseudomonas capeferrum]|uniref:PilN domain-containing protein n=1 Tax=Pseudomonas capeferrum TaxID=1495066 RepID=UPI0015E489A2|nr:PilN domain-containing protein [Pseudomonas capeferrum]MBA1202358.1 PilN domain-containing protein [Pseudomonas capeferrum]
MSVRPNLLPWRERKRVTASRQVQAGLIGALLLGLVIVWSLDHVQRQRLHRASLANAELRTTIEDVQRQLDRLADTDNALAAVRTRLASMRELRQGQARVPELLAALERVLPGGLQLHELKLDAGRLHLGGLAASASVIARFMRELQGLAVVRELELQWIRSQAAGDRFQLVGQLRAGTP